MDWSAVGLQLAQIPGQHFYEDKLTILKYLLKYHCMIFSYSGIVETGLFVNMAAKTYFGNADGSVKVAESNKLLK